MTESPTTGHCPFHSDTESTIRHFRDGSFECTRCGWHGDAVTRIMVAEGISMADAIKRQGPSNG